MKFEDIKVGDTLVRMKRGKVKDHLLLTKVVRKMTNYSIYADGAAIVCQDPRARVGTLALKPEQCYRSLEAAKAQRRTELTRMLKELDA